MSDTADELIEIRCLWLRTDYGHISLRLAARGFGGRELGSYQDEITNERFEKVRQQQAELNPEYRLVESVIKVPIQSVEALFTDGTEIVAIEGSISETPKEGVTMIAVPHCPHCGSVAPFGDPRLQWIDAHIYSRRHIWWWTLRKKLKRM